MQVSALRRIDDDGILGAAQIEDIPRNRCAGRRRPPTVTLQLFVFIFGAVQIAVSAIIRFLCLCRLDAASSGIARADILPVLFQNNEITAHIGCRKTILILRRIDPPGNSPVVEVADRRSIYRNETLVRRIDIEGPGLHVDLPRTSRGDIEGVNRSFICSIQQEQIQATDDLTNRERQFCDRDAVVVRRRSLRTNQPRHFNKLAVV